ncbi:MAG: ferrous iron transport protein B [Oscillospiraceae bacterium]
MMFALAGNQNCGKTTLFNQLTGSNQHVGNFPGVTVEQKSGVLRGRTGVTVVDLPGIYSIRPYTSEELVTRDFLLKERPDGIINIADATNLERNLYLTLQLIELEMPMVLALNMMDEVRINGGSIDVVQLSQQLGIPVVPISAVKNEGIEELIDRAVAVAREQHRPTRLDFCTGAVHRCIHATGLLLEDHAERAGLPARFAATKAIEGDEAILEALGLNSNEREMIEHAVTEMEHETGTDRNAALADMRYAMIEQCCRASVVLCEESRGQRLSVRLDHVLTHRILAIPLFLTIMLLVFWLTFDVIGAALSEVLTFGIDTVTAAVDAGLTAIGINPVVHSLVIDGIFVGVGSVLSFLPIIVTLFFFLSLLEDSGYMARVAFVMDRPLRRIGLSGRSFVPMLIGFGCSVPAIMATRTLASERDRKMTILLTPFMSCSAKVPIYAVFSAAFFPGREAVVISLLYLMGILVGILCGLLLKGSMFRGNPVPFVMELPNYRMPSAKSVALLLWDKARDFLTRAFTIIFVASIVIWILQTFDARLFVVKDSSDSLLASLGRLVAPLLSPLGFGDWRIAAALVTGFTAKEALVSTLAVLTGSSMTQLSTALSGLFTPASAVAFLTFTLLYTPCVAAVAAVRREMGSKRSAVGVVLLQTAIAWSVSFLALQVAHLLRL